MAQQAVIFGVETAQLAAVTKQSDYLIPSYQFAFYNAVDETGQVILDPGQLAILGAAFGLSDDALGELSDSGIDVSAETHAVYMARAMPASADRGRMADTRRSTGERARMNRIIESMLDDELAEGSPGLSGKFTEVPDRDILYELARSRIGFLFLDRTRITPIGLAIGEHIYSLALAPGEEAVLEQRTFLQREATREDTGEEETTIDTDSTTSGTNELVDTINEALSQTRTSGFGAGGQIGFDYVVKVDVDAKVSNSTTDADSDSRTRAVKLVKQTTEKLAAKIRDLHRVQIRIAAVDRFERSAKRTVRNPNAFTPIDLEYFKVLERLQIAHERYGVRLCWAPHVKDPAFAFIDREQKAWDRILREERAKIEYPAEVPVPQEIAQVSGHQIAGLQPPLAELTSWGFWGDMRADYTMVINAPADTVWDGDIAFLQGSLRSLLTGGSRGFGVNTVGDPWEIVDGNGNHAVAQIIHAGVDWGTGGLHLYVSLSAGFNPDGSSVAAANAEAQAQYQAKLAERAKQVAKLEQEAADAARIRFEAWKTEHRKNLNVEHELAQRFIAKMFEPDARDEVAELDLWNQVFDWEHAGIRLYSGTWNDGELREPSLSPHHFLNASWARLFLPIRPDYEEVALRWIYARRRTGPVAGRLQTFFDKVLKSLRDWRVENLGTEDEVVIGTPATGQICPPVEQKYACLGTWEETVPSDGLHVEVVQAPTTAADGTSGAGQTSEDALRAAILAGVEADTALKTKVTATIKPNNPSSITINIEPGPLPPSTSEG
jgi:hypothetical protein